MEHEAPKKRGRKKKDSIVLREPHLKAYRYIDDYIKKRIISPNKRVVALGTKISYRHIMRILNDLVQLGYITTSPTIKIVKEL